MDVGAIVYLAALAGVIHIRAASACCYSRVCITLRLIASKPLLDNAVPETPGSAITLHQVDIAGSKGPLGQFAFFIFE